MSTYAQTCIIPVSCKPGSHQSPGEASSSRQSAPNLSSPEAFQNSTTLPEGEEGISLRNQSKKKKSCHETEAAYTSPMIEVADMTSYHGFHEFCCKIS